MQDSFLTRGQFADAELEQAFSDRAIIANLTKVEGTLARVQGDLGLLEKQSAEHIARQAENLDVPVDTLMTAMATSGVPVADLVALLRDAVGPDHADQVHVGATSQDIVDTALVLSYRDAFQILVHRLGQLLDAIENQYRAHKHLVTVARTRTQLATPIPFGLRLANWAQPLINLEEDADQIAKHALKVQLGGASGSLSVMGAKGQAVSDALADALDLTPAYPWHTDRQGLGKLIGWASGITTACSKLASDLLIAGRNEIGEIRTGAGGGSSAMPHKSNPVTAEAIVTLSHIALACEAGLATSRVHREDRDGAMWAVEWLLLPRLCVATGTALNHTLTLVDAMQPNAEVMAERIQHHSEVMAEAVVSAMTPRLGKTAAHALVTAALADERSFAQALRSRGPADMDWSAILDPHASTNPALAMADAIFAVRTGVAPRAGHEPSNFQSPKPTVP